MALHLSRSLLVEFARPLFDGPPSDAVLLDIAGEVCNRIVGRFKDRFDAAGFRLGINGMPEILAADDSGVLTLRMVRPSVVVGLDAAFGAIFVELTLGDLDESILEPEAFDVPFSQNEEKLIFL
jgi:hypothetical protein